MQRVPLLIIVKDIDMMQMNVRNAKVLIILILQIINAYQKLQIANCKEQNDVNYCDRCEDGYELNNDNTQCEQFV